MRFVPSGVPKDLSSLGVLGYLIVVNKQIHSNQLDILSDYLKSISLDIRDTVIESIIDGKEDSISLASSIVSYGREETSIQRDIYYMLIALSFVDNAIDDNEMALINRIVSESSINESDIEALRLAAIEDADEIRSNHNHLFEKPKPIPVNSKENWLLKLIHIIVAFFRNLFGISQNESVESDEDHADTEYKTAIEQCAVVASEDFQLLRPSYSAIIEKTQDCIKDITDYKRSLSLETGLSAEVASIVKVFADALNENVLLQNQKAEESLVQKERTISDFTISLIGRTKAGKSTLHAILTNQGNDKIGAGKQRTTRYNRVYQWNLLRLIDTPGIGSAEAGGRTDDEIAESVLGESDVICFVIVDDSILKDVLEFIEKVASLNKPIIILLNHKENIIPEVKFRRYIEHPTDWLTCEGESNLAGHIHRIQKYADDKGFGALIKVFPVFLLAAQMASDENYQEHREVLWNSSNMDMFIDQLKKWIVFSGNIKRSQTILDEAVQIFEYSENQIMIAQEPVKAQIVELGNQREIKITALKKAKEEALQKIRDALREKFDNLAQNEALLFAEEVFSKKGDITDYWDGYLDRIHFEDEIKSAIEIELSTYQRKADATIRELFEDFYYSMKNSFDMESISIPMLWDFKSITRLVGSALGVVGTIVTLILGASNPIGWVLSGAGILAGLGSLLFSSKEEKRQKAINKIYESIRKSIIEQAPGQIEKTVQNIDSQLEDNIERIDSLFEDLIIGLQDTIKLSEDLTVYYGNEIVRINKLYAWRIIQFLKGETNRYSEESMASLVQYVDRSQRGKITIGCPDKDLDVSILDGIIADQVIIV